MPIDEDLAAFGRALRRCRTSAKLSQEEIADRADLHRNYIGLMERGERNPNLKTIVALAKALGVSAAEFFRAEDGGAD